MRLHGWDYSSPGCYFVTICVKNKECFLADVENGKAIVNVFGKIVDSRWTWLTNQYSYLQSDAFVVMPNHVHGLVRIIPNSAVTGRDLSLPTHAPAIAKNKSLSDIIGAFKMTSSKDIHLAGFPNFFWQRSFYEKIIRSEREANAVRQYIMENHLNWDRDDENPVNKNL